jgi:hypothetical protein
VIGSVELMLKKAGPVPKLTVVGAGIETFVQLRGRICSFCGGVSGR